MIEIKIVPYEDMENTQKIHFLNPLTDIKKQLLNHSSDNFEDALIVADFLKILNVENMVNRVSAVKINEQRFECLEVNL